MKKSIEIAEDIAKKSPVAIQVSKISMVYSRDHSVQEGLEHIVSMPFLLIPPKIENVLLYLSVLIYIILLLLGLILVGNI